MTGSRQEFVPGRVVPGSRYRLTSEVGQGGMGTVFEVEHIELGKKFVLKAVLEQHSASPDLVRRLREEWKALGRLEHPNIVSVTDAGTTSAGVPYFVMERLHGEDLLRRLRRGQLPLRDALRIGAEVLQALDAAHRIGVVHRDVKPSNVFLTEQGPVKLLDFGIAKLLDSDLSLTRQGAAVGTPRYMSPEQVAGEGVDSRSDLYAVGLLLYEMIAGNNPFEQFDEKEIFDAHLNHEAPPLSAAVAGIPEELERLVARLLHKSPHGRPSSAGSAAALLQAMRSSRGSIPPQRPGRESADRISTETLRAVRALLAHAPEPLPAGEADTVPSPQGNRGEDVDTEVLPESSDAGLETRTSVTGAGTPPPVTSAQAMDAPKVSRASRGNVGAPWRMLLAGLLGGALSLGVVVIALQATPPRAPVAVATSGARAQDPVSTAAGLEQDANPLPRASAVDPSTAKRTATGEASSVGTILPPSTLPPSTAPRGAAPGPEPARRVTDTVRERPASAKPKPSPKTQSSDLAVPPRRRLPSSGL